MIFIGMMILEALVITGLFVIIKYSKSKHRPLKERVKELKVEHYVIIFFYATLFVMVGYLLIANLFPNNPLNNFGNYEISASDIGMTNSLRSLYLDNDVFGGKTEIEEKALKMIISAEPFNIVFNPKKIIAENSSAILELSFFDVETEVYLDDVLIIPNLENYEKVEDFEDTSVFVKNTLTKENYVEAPDSRSFVYLNYPLQSVYSFAESEGGIPLIMDYSKRNTNIGTQFRDNLKLAVYAEGELEIKFTKQDLNMYVGKDEYKVEVEDYQGETHFSKVYKDEGEDKNTNKLGEEQYFEIKLDNLERNVYYITFTKDKYNKAGDSTIKNIKINSNKVLILGNSLPLNSFNFYTKVDSIKTIGFYYWHTGKEQDIEQTGIKEDTIELDEDWKGKKYEQELKDKGGYNFEISKGDLEVDSDVISPSEDSWFYLPKDADKKLIDSEIIIIDKTKLEIEGKSFIYNADVEVSEGSKLKIQILDKARIYFERAKLIL